MGFSDLNDHELDISNVFNELLNRNLIFEINENENVYFRSRMSETVRLLYHLRQMFHKKMLVMVGKMHQHLCQIIGSLEGQGFIQKEIYPHHK